MNWFVKHINGFVFLVCVGLYPRLYPELSQYMGLSLNEEEVQRNLPVAAAGQPQGVGISQTCLRN